VKTRARIAWLCLVAAVLAACPAKHVARTEILLEVDAGPMLRRMASELRIEIATGPKGTKMLAAVKPETFDVSKAGFQWPASLALVASSDHENNELEVTVTAISGGDPLARGRVRTSFLPGKTLLLRTSLFDVCLGYFDCGAAETCISEAGKAACTSSRVDAAKLPVFHKAAGEATSQLDAGSDASAEPQMSSEAGVSDAGPADAGETDAARDAGNDGGAKPDAAPTCTASGPEDCYNGVDDDCDGHIDCADSACSSSMCAPAGTTVGVLVPANQVCPIGFRRTTTLMHQGVVDPGCEGCGCSPVATTCTVHAFLYPDQTSCSADSGNTGGMNVGAVTYTCGAPVTTNYVQAWRVSMAASTDACTAAGNATPVAPTWTRDMKLCTTLNAGGGCKNDFACVPKVEGAPACAERHTAQCPASTTKQTWSTGFDDSRSCGACECSATGGGCGNVVAQMYTDYSCPGTTTPPITSSLHDGAKDCGLNVYSPPVQLAGAPTDPTCSAHALVVGALTETGSLELCCTP
jgi:hypothetical protein